MRCRSISMVSEWSRSRAMLEDILGHAVDVASVPGGYFSAVVARAAREAGIRVLFTSEPVTPSIPAGDIADRRPLHHPPRRSARPRAASRLRLRMGAVARVGQLERERAGQAAARARRTSALPIGCLATRPVERDVVTMGFTKPVLPVVVALLLVGTPQQGAVPGPAGGADDRTLRPRPSGRAAGSSCRPIRRAVAPCT